MHTFEIELDNLTQKGDLRNYEIEYDILKHRDGEPYVEVYSAVDLLTGEIQKLTETQLVQLKVDAIKNYDGRLIRAIRG